MMTENNSTFVNVTLSTKKMVNGKFPLGELRNSSRGWWVMNEEVAKTIEYVFPVRRNEVLGVFKVKSYEVGKDEKTGRTRVNFDLDFVFEGSTRLVETAKAEMSTTHYVVKQFSI